MNKNYYDIYKTSVFNLAETLVIKSNDTALAINFVLTQLYGENAVDPFDQTSWKYYKNICGQYHSTDRDITIISIDTLQTIRFTSENLLINAATRKAYQYGTRNYFELVSLYPDLEMLILGILYPANMDKAILSEEGTILSYPSILVEKNEYTLIEKLEAWIKTYKIRWYNNQFNISDSLYSTTHLGLLYLALVPAIINIRLQACKTNEAHSFHVRQYLASHGHLDIYLEDMTTKQALFFYRNILYIERNSGKKSIFYWLIEHIMTERNLPLFEITMKHNVSDMPNNLYPIIDFKRKPINKSFNSINIDKYNYTALLDKEKPLTTGNKDYIEQHTETIEKKLFNSLSSVVATKVLDSSLIDYTDATNYTFYDIVLNHWLSLSSTGIYSTYITIRNPKTGGNLTLHCKDAFIYFIYTLVKALGGNPTVIPKMLAQRVRRQPAAIITDLMEVADTKYITSSVATEILSLQSPIYGCVSVDAFYNQCREIFDTSEKQIRYVSKQEHLYKRAIVKNMVSRTYCDKFYSLEAENTTFSSWLEKNNLPTDDFSTLEYLDINKQLFEETSGSTIDSIAANRKLQKAMISLLEKLSSYSIQFITEINGSNLKLLNWASIRIGDKKVKAYSHVRVLDLNVEVKHSSGKSKRKIKVNFNTPYISIKTKSITRQKEFFKINVKPILSKNFLKQKQIFNIGNISLHQSSLKPLEINTDNFLGYNNYLALGITDPTILKDIYCDCFIDPISNKQDINNILLQNILDSWNTVGIINNSISGFNFNSLNGVSNGFEITNLPSVLVLPGFNLV